MTVAPQYQLLRPLRPEDYAALKESIAEIGVQQPVIFDEDGAVLDGHHRLQVCRELGIRTFPKMIKYELSETEKHDYVRSLNIARRHMSRTERRAFLRDVLIETTTATDSLSDRAIAARLAVDHKTVGTARANMVRRGEIPHVSRRTDTLGRSQPAERQRAVYVVDLSDGQHPDEFVSERSGGAQPAGPLDPGPMLRSSGDDAENSDKATNGGAAIGTKTRSKKERGVDFNQTPRCGIITLLELEKFSPLVWEPACGHGAISSVLQQRGYQVELSDLVDRECTDENGELQRVEDFLTSKKRDGQCPDIITNPPFGPVNAFIAHAMREHSPNKIAMLCNFNILCGYKSPDRLFFRDQFPPSRIHVFIRRLPAMHAENYDGEKYSSQLNTCWLVWEKLPDGTYPTAPSQTFSQDWQKHMDNAGEGDWRPDE